MCSIEEYELRNYVCYMCLSNVVITKSHFGTRLEEFEQF